MTRQALLVRRGTTVLAVILALTVGFLAIRVASAWTAASAPLSVSPGSVATLQQQLDAERARTAALTAEIERLVADSDQLSAAVEAARAQIGQESEHTAQVSADLEAAQSRLRDLEKAILDARAALARQRTTAITTTTIQAAPAREHDDEDEEREDHEEDEEHDDD
jgi:peptidoglycan hydrolase CwlO-like protein